MGNKIIKTVFLIVLMLLISGCAGNQPSPGVYGSVSDALASNMGESGEWKTNAYQTRIKPYIGTRQNDAKVIIDTGRVLKIWVAPYKQARTLIAAHDIYSMVQKPQFIVGEMVPSGRKKEGLTTCSNDFPFTFKDRHLETVSPKDRYKDENINRYVNNVYKAKKDLSYYDRKRKEANSRYDKTIRDYIK